MIDLKKIDMFLIENNEVKLKIKVIKQYTHTILGVVKNKRQVIPNYKVACLKKKTN